MFISADLNQKAPRSKPRTRLVARTAKGCPGGMLVQWYVCLSASACVVFPEWGIILEKHFCDVALANHIARYKYIIIKTKRKCEVPVPRAMPRPTIGETEHAGETFAKNTESKCSKRNIALYQCSTISKYYGCLLS